MTTLIRPGIPLDDISLHIQRCKKLRDMLATAIGRPLYPYQLPFSDRMIEAQLQMKGDELFTLMARQSGKTEATTLTVLALSVYYTTVLKRNYKVGVFAPAQSQAIDVFRSRIRERFKELEPLFTQLGVTSYLASGRYTHLFFIASPKDKTEARIRCMSSDRTADIKGESLDLIIIEQAEDADESKLKDDIFPMAAATGGIRVLNGTSTTSIVNDYFFDNCIKGGDDVFVVDCYEASKFNPTYAAYIETERERYGPLSPEFAAQYELKWEMVSNKFIMNREFFLSLQEDYTPAGGLMRDSAPLRRTAAWDPARGNDYSWVTVLEGEDPVHIIDWWYKQGMNLEQQAMELGPWLMQRGVSTLAIGVIGLGQGPADIMTNHFPTIELERITEGSVQQDIMFKLLEREIGNSRLHYPAADSRAKQLFLSQMLRAERKYVGNKLHVVAPKGHMSHDDAVDSLSMCLWTHLERRGGIVARSPRRPR